ncbi:hypothetical protein FRC11_007882 [Ceratobasidium sp. 423]|nr:hypothetical protein FRC11_007882 [Ceratobasidium sp. 423]
MFPISEMEAKCYYYGLPSHPILVARTGTTEWKEPTGLEGYRVIKELRPVGNHAITEVWEDNLALKIHALLDTMKVKWTSTDVVRIGNAKESLAPVILWIGVVPGSLSNGDGLVVAFQCQKLLEENDITDVEVEVRESVVTRSAGPMLLRPTHSLDPTVEVRGPLTTTLGLPICAKSPPWAQGTGGFFIAEGGNTELLLVTARHVLFPPGESENELFEHKENRPHHNVNLFGDAAFKGHLEFIQSKIEDMEDRVASLEWHIKTLEGTPEANTKREKAQVKLGEAEENLATLKTFYRGVSDRWGPPENRVLGHVVLSPPIDVGVGSEGYTEDWAVIEIDSSKIDKSNFDGNAIDLGIDIPDRKFTRMMYPNRRNPPSFKYPKDRLLKLKGTIPDEEMRNPTGFDQDNKPCLMVMKRGITTGLTIGRANNICSYARTYCRYSNTGKTSKEWAILPRDSESDAFSGPGDSGSVIVDGLGRIGGLLTGGTTGTKPSSDITYATPITFLLKRMAEKGLKKPHPVHTA